MKVLRSETFAIRTTEDIVFVRQTVRTWMLEIRSSIVDQTKMVTATSELARNTLVYGGGGTALLELLEEGCQRGLRVTFEDHGPGITDIEKAMTDGFTTSGGLGLGLGGLKRLVNQFDIRSEVGQGTVVTITRWV